MNDLSTTYSQTAWDCAYAIIQVSRARINEPVSVREIARSLFCFGDLRPTTPLDRGIIGGIEMVAEILPGQALDTPLNELGDDLDIRLRTLLAKVTPQQSLRD